MRAYDLEMRPNLTTEVELVSALLDDYVFPPPPPPTKKKWPVFKQTYRRNRLSF